MLVQRLFVQRSLLQAAMKHRPASRNFVLLQQLRGMVQGWLVAGPHLIIVLEQSTVAPVEVVGDRSWGCRVGQCRKCTSMRSSAARGIAPDCSVNRPDCSHAA